MSDILVYALHYEGAFNKNSIGAVCEAAKLAGELGGEAHAVVVGDSVTDELCAQLGHYGATKVYRVAGPEGLAQPVVDAMAFLIGERGFGYALFGGGLLGFEIGAGLAARGARRGWRADRAAADSRRLGDLGDSLPQRGGDHHRPSERVRDHRAWDPRGGGRRGEG
jgi:electron transfer flavoprotein alpha subunit